MRLVHRRPPARAEVLVGRAVVLLAVVVERIAARHLQVRVGVDRDQVGMVHERLLCSCQRMPTGHGGSVALEAGGLDDAAQRWASDSPSSRCRPGCCRSRGSQPRASLSLTSRRGGRHDGAVQRVDDGSGVRRVRRRPATPRSRPSACRTSAKVGTSGSSVRAFGGGGGQRAHLAALDLRAAERGGDEGALHVAGDDRRDRVAGRAVVDRLDLEAALRRRTARRRSGPACRRRRWRSWSGRPAPWRP